MSESYQLYSLKCNLFFGPSQSIWLSREPAHLDGSAGIGYERLSAKPVQPLPPERIGRSAKRLSQPVESVRPKMPSRAG